MAIADEAGPPRPRRSYKAATAALADPRKTTPEQAEADHRDGPADLLLQRGAALDRDRQPRDGHGDGLPAGRFRAADDPAHPQEPGRPHQPGIGARRPRQGGRLVLSLPEGQDRHRQPAAHVRRRTGAITSSTTTTAIRTRRRSRSRAPFIACSTTIHPTVVHDLHESIPAAHTLERHGAVQHQPRSDPHRRVVRDVVRGDPHADVARHAGRLDLGLRRRLGTPLPRLGGRQSQLHRPRLRNVRQRNRRDARARAARGARRRMPPTSRSPRSEWYRPWPPGPQVRGRSQQHELHADRLPGDSRLHRAKNAPRDAARLLPQGLQLLAEGSQKKSRMRSPSRADQGDPPPRRADGRCPAEPSHRDRARARSAFTVAEGTYPAGTFVVRLDQPYRNYAVDLLAPQKFPSDSRVHAL